LNGAKMSLGSPAKATRAGRNIELDLAVIIFSETRTGHKIAAKSMTLLLR